MVIIYSCYIDDKVISDNAISVDISQNAILVCNHCDNCSLIVNTQCLESIQSVRVKNQTVICRQKLENGLMELPIGSTTLGVSFFKISWPID